MSTPDNDYLGYGVYADSLWKRIQSALDKDSGGKPLGDDPLVVGLFGEWGAGKSKLLSLIQDRAQLSANTLAERRKQDGGNFTMLVPVFFQPWKYEHEKHLHVPLVLHILEALTKQIELAQTWTEWAGGRMPDGIKQHLGTVVALVKALAAATALAVGTAVPLATAASLASAGLLAKLLQWSKSKNQQPVSDTFEYLDNGRFFYEMHEVLRAITRPTSQQKYLTGVQLNTSVKINFVIFIDDLDRCLPENAVGTLELIKTIFNVESFAFVLALDDEVIERGIGHRYQAYNFAGKKPEMPITGFEYLEKIVHLPFRLPALTQKQAMHFIRNRELYLEQEPTAQLDREKAALDTRLFFRWGRPLGDDLRSAKQGSEEEISVAERHTDLTYLLLAAFDQYVPRKLIRAMELLYQIHRVRALPSAMDLRSIDRKILFVLLLVQLFQPELYRVLRRRKSTFKTLLLAFYDGSDLVTNGSEVSELALWSWAAFYEKRKAGASEVERPHDLQKTIQFIAKTWERGDLYAAQQVRLPLAERLVEHLKIERHAFNPFKLLESLAKVVQQAEIINLDIDAYLAYLSDDPKDATTTTSQETQVPEQREAISVNSNVLNTFFERLTSSDLGVQSEVADILKADEYRNKVLDQASSASLHNNLQEWITKQSDQNKSMEILLNGLQHLAPHIARGDGEKFWNLVKNLNPIPTKVNDPTSNPKLAALYADTGSLLGQDKRFEPTRFYLLKDRFKEDNNKNEDEPIAGFVRIQGKKLDDTFYMARTLTTVDQYKCFVDAGQDKKGGYFDETLWDAQGLAWLKGDDSAVKDDWLKKRLASRAFADRQQPASWYEQLAFGSRPVLCVNWFEARAYARWLTKQLAARGDLEKITTEQDFQVRLPTEAQWVRAVEQGVLQVNQDVPFKPTDFPWGSDDANAKRLANVEGSGIGHASAVGCFAPNPLGLLDMAGNLWEWQDNLKQKSGKEIDMKQINRLAKLEANDDFIMDGASFVALRGGSWIGDPVLAGVSYRAGDLPGSWDGIIGFRVMLSLAK